MRIGLSLSGGGIKGAAHIGVLQALEEENIKIEYISGASSGSIVAALYAAGFKPQEIYYIFKKYAKNIRYINFKNIIELILGLIFTRSIVIKGLNSGAKIEKLVEKVCAKKGIRNIRDIEMPLFIPSVNLNNGDVYIFSSVEKQEEYQENKDEIIYMNNIEIGKAVRASCSYPRNICTI